MPWCLKLLTFGGLLNSEGAAQRLGFVRLPIAGWLRADERKGPLCAHEQQSSCSAVFLKICQFLARAVNTRPRRLSHVPAGGHKVH